MHPLVCINMSWKSSSTRWILDLHSIMQPAISDPTPKEAQAPSTVMMWWVFLTELAIVSISIGLIVRKLITSHEIPLSFSNCCAACNDQPTKRELATMVISFPSRSILAFPMGSKKSSCSAASDMWWEAPYSSSFSKKTTGLGSRIAALSNPLASSELQGERTFRPGTAPYQAL